jgi:CRP-like cAMP-binding protein
MIESANPGAAAIRRLVQRMAASPEGAARRRSFAAGEAVYRPGDAAGGLFFLESGRVRMMVESPEGKRKTLGYVEPGNLFGESALCGHAHRPDLCMCDRPCSVVEIPMEELRRWMTADPMVAEHMLAMLSGRLTEARVELGSLVFDPVRERVMRRLMQLLEQRASADQLARGEPVTLDITHAQLAMAVGAARETVSTDVEDFKREGMLEIRRGRLQIRPDRLRRALADEAARRRNARADSPPTVSTAAGQPTPVGR